MKKIVVTGGSGKAGGAALHELAAHGYDVLNADSVLPHAGGAKFRCKQVDLCDLGEVHEVLSGADGVVHMAAIPNEMNHTGAHVFRNNTLSTYNIFEAAKNLGLARVVWASSETVLGLSFTDQAPRYAPVDDDHAPYPNSSYSLSKSVGEEMAAQFSRWRGVPHVGLRFSNIFLPEDYARIPEFWEEPKLRSWNLWGYVDVRDVGVSCRLGLEAAVEGAPNYTIAAADTVMNRSSTSLMAEVFPEVEIRRDLGEFETLLSIDKARRELGFEPQYSWRD